MQWINQKVKTFFSTARKSMIEPRYYKDIAKAPFSFSLKYLFALLTFITFGYMLPFAITLLVFIPQIPTFVEAARTTAADYYPEDLVLTLENGTLYTNVQEPYYLPFPGDIELDEDYSHLVAIDTRASVEDYPDYNAMILLTDTHAVYVDRLDTQGGDAGDSYKVYAFADGIGDVAENSIVFDRSVYDEIVTNVSPLLNYVYPAAIALVILLITLLPFVVALGTLVGNLMYLAVVTVFLLLLAKLLKKKLDYNTLYRFSLHMNTVPVVVAMLFTGLGLELGGMWSFLMFLAFGGYILSSYDQKK